MMKKEVAVALVVLSMGGLYLWHSRQVTKLAPVPEEHRVESIVAPPVEPLAKSDPVAPPKEEPRVESNGGPENSAPITNEPRVAPKVDIVFALDTTSSMGSLIEGAKAKIWELARRAQQGQPAPQLRVGLVAYRDRGDAFARQRGGGLAHAVAVDPLQHLAAGIEPLGDLDGAVARQAWAMPACRSRRQAEPGRLTGRRLARTGPVASNGR